MSRRSCSRCRFAGSDLCAGLLADKTKRHGSPVRLVNTGWSGGAYGVVKRIKLAHTGGGPGADAGVGHPIPTWVSRIARSASALRIRP